MRILSLLSRGPHRASAAALLCLGAMAFSPCSHAQISGPGATFGGQGFSGGGFSAPSTGFGTNAGAQFGSAASHPAPVAPVVVTQPVPYRESDATQGLLSDIASWLAPQLAPFGDMRARVLPMDQAPYLRFAQSRSAIADDNTPVGHWALEALFLADGQTNGEKTPLCFLLYNPAQIQALDAGFFAPARRLGEESAGLAFVVAHESGHCIDFEQGTSAAPAQWSADARNGWLEYGADLFAGLTLLQGGAPISVLEAIVKTRDFSGDAAHATAPALREMLREWNSGAIDKSMTPRERWQTALRIRRETFRP